jgi:hypothetical protein
VVVVSGAFFYGSKVPSVVAAFLSNDKIAVALSGLLLAVFSSNILVLLATRPYVKVLDSKGENLSALVPSGVYLGWVERALVFIFIAAGQAEAAALVIAAKSLVRFPEVQRHQGTFGQYVIVGTLASLLVATSIGVFVRLSFGLPPL